MGAVRMSSRGGSVAQMGLDSMSIWTSCSGDGEKGVERAHMMKNKPAMPPTGTQRDRAFGSLVVGSSHSSAIDDIMPIAEKLVVFVSGQGSQTARVVEVPTYMQMAACL